MSMLWVICGSGRYVGKTTLAMELCNILPSSIYAKCGRSKQKHSKPENFFRTLKELNSFIEDSQNKADHIVVESNTLALQDRSDITIFVDGVSGKTDFRKDAEQLKQKADIVISTDVTSNGWEETLNSKLKSSERCKTVCNCLASQKNYLFASAPNVRSKVWFELNGSRIFGRGLAKLLKNIEKLGTLQGAAKTANMSYRYAWNLIHIAEERLNKTLVCRHTGGSTGGGSCLSEDGIRMLRVFERLNDEVADFANERFSVLFNKENVDD